MLLQTNSYIVPKDKRAEHQRVLRRFRQTLKRLGCHHFEVYEQVGPNWASSEASGRYVQILRFADRKHQLSVQQAERSDPAAQAVIADFCDLINFPYQQQQGLFAVGFYTSVLPVAPLRGDRGELIPTVEHEGSDPAPDLSAEPPSDDADPPPEEPMTDDTPTPAGPVPTPAPPPPRARAATVERHHEMIDSVTIDGPLTGPGELFDVLEADAPVDGLDGTPPETVPLVSAPAPDEEIPDGVVRPRAGPGLAFGNVDDGRAVPPGSNGRGGI